MAVRIVFDLLIKREMPSWRQLTSREAATALVKVPAVSVSHENGARGFTLGGAAQSSPNKRKEFRIGLSSCFDV